MFDSVDNCPLAANADQLDTDGDNTGNVCDPDDDNDGLSDVLELSIGTDTLRADTDGDGISDYNEVNYDGNPNAYTPDADLNPLSADTDGDGLGDGADTLPLLYNYNDGDVAPLGAPNGVVDARRSGYHATHCYGGGGAHVTGVAARGSVPSWRAGRDHQYSGFVALPEQLLSALEQAIYPRAALW